MFVRILIFSFSFSLLASSCSGPGANRNSDTAAAGKKAEAGSPRENREVLHADEKSLTDKLTLPEMYLAGKEVNIPYRQVSDELKKLIPPLMKAAADQKAVLTGSYYIALLENPADGKSTRIFIGLPTKKPVKLSGFQQLTIPGGQFLRHQTTAEPGTALQTHLTVMNPPGKMSRKTGLPILETYAETRNNEMTSVISKATFLYPVK